MMFHVSDLNWELTVKYFMKLNQKLSDSVKTYTPELWFPFVIVLLNSILRIVNTQYIYAQLELPEIPHNIQIAISVLGSFSVIAGAFITWILISVIIFFWCELFYDVEGSFRHFFEIVGICHLLLLVGTLTCSVVIISVLPDDLTRLEANAVDSQELLEAITERLSLLKLIGTIVNICFGLALTIVVWIFFEIKWFRALWSVCIPYTIYYALSRTLKSVFQFN